MECPPPVLPPLDHSVWDQQLVMVQQLEIHSQCSSRTLLPVLRVSSNSAFSLWALLAIARSRQAYARAQTKAHMTTNAAAMQYSKESYNRDLKC